MTAILFNHYIERVLDELREEIASWNDIKIQGHKVDLKRYADNTALISSSKIDLEMSLNNMQNILMIN